jgi:hypothetical protein
MTSHFFSLKLLCKKNTYNINYCVVLVKKHSKLFFMSCIILQCVELGVALNSLLIFCV